MSKICTGNQLLEIILAVAIAELTAALQIPGVLYDLYNYWEIALRILGCNLWDSM